MAKPISASMTSSADIDEVGVAAEGDGMPEGQDGEADCQPAMKIAPAAVMGREALDKRLAEERGHGQHQKQRPSDKAQQDTEAVEGR